MNPTLSSLLARQVAAAAQAGAFIHAATSASAAGWDANIFAGIPSGQPTAFLYLCDITEDFFWLATIGGNRVADALAGVRAGGHADSDIRDSLGVIFDFLVPGAVLPPGFSQQEVASIGAGTALAYAAQTQTWQQMGGMSGGGHFVILRYRQSEKNWLLRPFALRGALDVPIPVDALIRSVAQVITIDQGRHPEWFPEKFSPKKGVPR